MFGLKVFFCFLVLTFGALSFIDKRRKTFWLCLQLAALVAEFCVA